ncbi:MAG: hypothetical protein RL375_4902 [Pseudomonadota bacterium]|jgi:hypothetical protein
MNLSSNVKISSAITPAAGVAAATDLEGTTLDMLGYRGVMMVVRFGAIDGGAVTSIKAQQDSVSTMATAADLLGTGQTIADNDDNECFVIDLYEPRERYVRLYVDRGTQNAVVASAEYIQYDPMVAVTTQGSGVTAELHVSPAEGTA